MPSINGMPKAAVFPHLSGLANDVFAIQQDGITRS
jgi:hypothetical protein